MDYLLLLIFIVVVVGLGLSLTGIAKYEDDEDDYPHC